MRAPYNQATRIRRIPRVCFVVGLTLTVWVGLPAALLAGTLHQIDSFGVSIRKIPDITGNPGDSITLDDSLLIDVLILGDGYLSGEESSFLDNGNTNSAHGWCNFVFGRDGNPGLRPFNLFPQAFRVRALYEESPERAGSVGRNSHYRVKIDGTAVSDDGWQEDDLFEANRGFRDSVYISIDEVTPLNEERYSGFIDAAPADSRFERFRRLYIVMLCRIDDGMGVFSTAGGRTFPVRRVGGPEWVRMGVGKGTVHEWGHAFGYHGDEYILLRGSVAGGESNPPPALKSVFNLYNVTFSNDRGDLLWPHLAPGGTYNPDPRSPIGNLWRGSAHGDIGSWHSEYRCLMNGGHENYYCDTTDVPINDLRDSDAFCLWCEELTAVSILERTGELARLSGNVGTFDNLGRQWYQYWNSSLRSDYFAFTHSDSLIASKNECYDLFEGGTCAACTTSCDEEFLPPCLPACHIREIGNAIYADPSGFVVNNGKKATPIPALSLAIDTANAVVPGTPIIVVRSGVQPGPITITTPLFLITDKCTSAILGQ